MATFSISRVMTQDQEGGFWNDPSAGYTYAGITQKYYPSWPGFKIIKQLQQSQLKGRAIPRYTIFKNAALDKAVGDFYKSTFWDKKVNGDYIKNQTIANFVYDFILHKENAAIRVVNDVAEKINPDADTSAGSLSDDVIDTANKNPDLFYKNIYAARLNYYNTAKGFSTPTRKQFIARVNKFPAPVVKITGIGGFDDDVIMFEKLIRAELKSLPLEIINQAKKGADFRKVLAGYIARKWNYATATVDNFLRNHLTKNNSIGSIGYFTRAEIKDHFEKVGKNVNPYNQKVMTDAFTKISHGIDNIVKTFPDASISTSKGFAVLKYNKGNGLAKIALQPGVYDIVYHSFFDAKIKYA